MNRVNSHDLWEVQAASKQLNMVASTLMNKHISNGPLKLKFSQSVARHGQCLVKDFEKGRKGKAQVLKEFKKEERSLWEQNQVIGTKGIGFVAGVMQIASGTGMCFASVGSMCAFGAMLIAHGSNNVYENGRYFFDGNENHVGLVRQGYRGIAEFAGYDASYGDIAYYGIDLGLSAKVIWGRSTKIKPPTSGNFFKDSKKFKLLSYTAEDYLRGYQATSNYALGFGVMADGMTARSLIKEIEKQ
ncbi:DUF4225 domain-containing protein [Vibrio europaeus]|uniref:DUF4225 domain-containing protein n=1 Tax=Vibrio europaeus TaxID=300876 RepID=UPI0023419F91|nr:DUF4225 domain-containing protein [Vibrio europaeus]MDC5842522.1 DUF4225 domain-containing protein [Vibrio europaeus]